ncbi:MAG: DUF5683 domain-containing protein [Vicingaceae bacterium]
MCRAAIIKGTFLLFVLLLHGQGSILAQRDTIYTDTLNLVEADLPKHSPTKATLYSTLVPGLGQAFNKKYWKIPIIYAGIGVCTFIAIDQNKLFEEKKTAYVNRVNGDSTDVFLELGNFFSNDALLRSMDINRRNRDLMIILGSAVYILQIVDAAVDAHLFYFNVSNDLSLHYKPYFDYDPRTGSTRQGLALNLNF